MAKIFTPVFLFLLLRGCNSEYFEDQPKLLTENGNFVIESAVDRNISFRLKGSSYLNVNDLNVMSMIGGGSAQPNARNTDLAIRVSALEDQLRSQQNSNDNSRPMPNQNIMRRLRRLENRMNDGSNSMNTGDLTRRVRNLEMRFNRLIDRLNADNCSSNPCQNAGTCTNVFNGYVCKCSNAWTGRNCNEDVNECANFAGTDLGCQNLATCENTPGGYNCRCKPGWVGIHCTKRTVDCLHSSSYELCGHGVCVHTNDPNSYGCICDQGWTSNGTSPACTVDVNECQLPNPHCSMDPEVQCINLPGSYTCGPCPNGYTGNGHYCRDIDECQVNNGGCSLLPFVQCVNTRGSSKCGSCPFGYTGDGRICIRSSPSSNRLPSMRCDNPGICHPLATCVQNAYSDTCICPPHYVGNGIGPRGCIRSNSTYDTCTPNPCLNGGTCSNSGLFGFQCDCPLGTVLPLCQHPESPCSSNPCRNGGTCRVLGDSYQCACPAGHRGRNCQSTTLQCGGRLISSNGTLKYPPTSGTYSHNSRCAWVIQTDEDHVLNITFTNFDLEDSLDCRFDWLQIHDGGSSGSHNIGRFCGTQLQGRNITSTINMLYLWFRSDGSQAHRGFELHWTSIAPVCGGEIRVQSHGVIASPGSPGHYPPNRDCIWTLIAPPGKRVHLHFFTMQLEEHETCEADYLAIYSGMSTDGDLLEKFCNTTHPEPLISPTTYLTLHFHSDELLSDAGFQIHYSLIEGMQGCGGTFTAKSGEIGSPIENGKYPKNVECHYLIRMPYKDETRIKLKFLSFNLEGSGSCRFDYVAIYEGHDTNAPKVGSWCGNRLPPDYSSLSNELLVVFRTDFSISHEGFRLRYDTLCGGQFEDENGVITSPWYPNPYDDNKVCVYDIIAPLGKAIILNFTAFDIEADCDFDSLSIYDGVDVNATKIGTYCGAEKPPAAISTFNHLHLVFQTNSADSGPGFKASYSFINASCGGVIKKTNLTISPPTSERNRYLPNSECKWMIIAPPQHIIELRFVSFSLEPSYHCQFDYVAFYDGIVTAEANQTAIEKYCGREKPQTFLSSTNQLTVFFKSDDSWSLEGFLIEYDFIDGSHLCGGNFSASAGSITTPNYPNQYESNNDCVYVIHAPQGKQIELNVESFNLEDSPICRFDSLEIRNGANDRSPLIGTYCGTEILPRFQSFANHMYLRFKSDFNEEYKGFKINYNTALNGCGGVFANAQSGKLSSPHYPEHYMANMQCDYTIQVARGSTIKLEINDLDMESSEGCNFDSISIYDGPNAAAKLIGTYCLTEQVTQIESSSNALFIRMISDFNNQGRGFEMTFRTNCKREIHDLRGAIESPNFPSPYPNHAQCEWKIVPPMGNRVFLEFSHFDFEDFPHCGVDFLIIEEQDSSGDVIHSNRYCENMPKPVNSSHTVVIKFETDSSVSAGGFHLEYEIQGCGGVLNKPSGTFTSPNYPNAYPHDTHCQWMIEVEYGHLIEITFTDFDFESSGDCSQDGVTIASDVNGTHVLNQFCGSKENQTVTSIGNKVYVNLYTDFSGAGRGFAASYKSINSKCGGINTMASGRIHSVNYPMNYESNSNCQWLLRTEPSHSIDFIFKDFDLENLGVNCSADFVSIYDGAEIRDDKLLLKTCGDQATGRDSSNQTRPGFNKPLRSSANEMLVIMQTDGDTQAKGFDAEYTTACGSKINTSSSGILEIGQNLRWMYVDCEWTITANDPSQHVSLTILHIDNDPILNKMLPASALNQTNQECARKIFIHDGTSTRAPKIAEVCSSKHPPTITSQGHALTISLGDIGEYVIHFAFDLKASYTVLDNECGGVFSSVSGQIASPGYPRTYENNIECEYVIKASPGSEMALNIDMMDIDQTDDCNGDYLEVRESSSSGKLIGVYCGKDIPSAIPSTNTYWLKFRSDNDRVGNGFRLEYNYAKLVEQTGSSGVITSLMYPNYLFSLDGTYQWRVSVKPGFLIRLTIDNCIMKRDTVVSIYDGYDSASGILAKIEGDNIPTDPILSSQNIIMIELEIGTFSETKFKFIWNEVPKLEADNSTVASDTLNCTKNSVIVVDPMSVLNLKSPGYPNGYDAGLDCKWTFLPSQMGYHVSLMFNTIDLEQTSNCLADYVRVGSGSDMESFVDSASMCSMSLGNRYSTFHGTPNLRVKFESDYAINRTGFDARVMLDCGGTLEGSQGQITHEMTSRNRMNNTCMWTVSVKRGRTIQFNFEKLRLLKNVDGTCNSFIVIRNGIHEDSPFLGAGKYCDGHPTIPKTSSNKATVHFQRNSGYPALNEFILNYQQIEHDCGGSITLDHSRNSTIITSPNYPNIPSPHIECVWRVTAPNGELLKIEFLDRFDIKPNLNCSTEYVEIREGSTSTAPAIGKYCGAKPFPIFSSSNMVRITFFTDISPLPSNGFKLKASFARCGKSIVAYDGYITSPGFPGIGAYPTQSTCDYHIRGPAHQYLNITFLSLDLPEDHNCTNVDHIEIYSIGRNLFGGTSNTEVTRVCGTLSNIQGTIHTLSSSALIRFVTKSGNNLYGGFRLKFDSSSQMCGSNIQASTGIIQSPGYPRSQRSFDCEWFITVPKGRRVKIEVLDIDVGSEQSLSFFNDFRLDSIIRSLTGTQTTPAPIYSSDNIMLVIAFIYQSNDHRGFKLRFSSDEAAICGGNFNENNGTIESPVVTSFSCEFTRNSKKPFFESNPDQGTLAIKMFDISNRTSCAAYENSGVEISFPNRGGRIVTTKCPANYDVIATPYTDTKLTIRSTRHQFRYRFTYKIHNCGGIVTDAMRTISSPTFEQGYGDVDCAWQYTSSSERSIQLILNARSLNCETDYLHFYNGKTSSRPRVERICSNEAITNRSITITGQSVFIEYHSANYNPSSNFQIEIVSSDGVCGGQLTAPHYIFSSPKNGTKYPANAECEWIIQSPSGTHVGLQFTGRFMIENSQNCTKDYVSVYTKRRNEFVLMSKFCGREMPPTLNTTGRDLKVLFHSDDSGDGDGFRAVWSANCGGTFKAGSTPQVITSPRYPSNYPANAFCNYSIVANEGESVTVKFLDFKLEGGFDHCKYDNVTIYKGTSYSREPVEMVGTYCRRNSVTTFRYPQRIDVVFRSDFDNQNTGFKFEYSVDRCGGNITAPTQITSLHDNPNEGYLSLASCAWYITAPVGRKIIVRFEHFDLEENPGCHLDYVAIFQGHEMTDKMRKVRLCGNLTEHQSSVSIDSNKGLVKFATDESINGKGFSALILFAEDCDEHIDLTSSQRSHVLDRLSGQYDPMLNCEIFISAPVGYVVQAKFSEFHVAACETVNNSCTCDYLNVRDGAGPFAELIGSYCGNSNPPDILTTGGSLYMRFVTDEIGFATGFRVELEMVETPCGASTHYLNDSVNSVTIESPMNGNKYIPNANCIWKISADLEKLIEIKFDKFDLESDPSNKCTLDYLEITDDESHPHISEGLGESTVFAGTSQSKTQYFFYGKQWPTAPHRYCGSGHPIDYLSTYKTVFVKFRSNEVVQRSGFKFTASILPECARNYTKPQGRLISKSLSNCELYISVPENNTISLYFTSMDIHMRTCTEETNPLKIYDGKNNQLLESYCGDTVPNPLFTTTNLLRLKFTNASLMYVANELYDITYLATDKGRGCGGELYNYGGTFSSPGYPNSDRNNSDCTWTIDVPMNLVVALQFQVFDMGPKSTCEQNYVEIMEFDETLPSTRFCGNDQPVPYKSKSSRLKVHFKSGRNLAGTGWLANFMAVHEDSILRNY